MSCWNIFSDTLAELLKMFHLINVSFYFIMCSSASGKNFPWLFKNDRCTSINPIAWCQYSHPIFDLKGKIPPSSEQLRAQRLYYPVARTTGPVILSHCKAASLKWWDSHLQLVDEFWGGGGEQGHVITTSKPHRAQDPATIHFPNE